ncbi:MULTISPECIES: hypothetical protein [unclassified Pseudomonas]|uniref:Uncharacterized protein n=1 Tax=Pseudomonas sp. 13.2 TaxID=3144665 RepID=A0AAU7BD05_9PSED|nr:hypothetical protein [Pseudomonas sp. SWI36]
MSVKRNFLMTYTVTAYLDEDRVIADRGRRKIAEMDVLGWVKAEGIETAFSGTLTLPKGDIDAQRHEASEQVYNTIKEQMKQADAYTACQVSIIFLVDGLGPHFMLTV